MRKVIFAAVAASSLSVSSCSVLVGSFGNAKAESAVVGEVRAQTARAIADFQTVFSFFTLEKEQASVVDRRLKGDKLPISDPEAEGDLADLAEATERKGRIAKR